MLFERTFIHIKIGKQKVNNNSIKQVTLAKGWANCVVSRAFKGNSYCGLKSSTVLGIEINYITSNPIFRLEFNRYLCSFLLTKVQNF